MKHLLISSPKANTQTHFSSSLENLELFYLLSLKSFSLLLLLLFLPPTIGGGAVLLGEPLQLSRGRTGKGADTDCQWVGYVEWNFLCSKIIADNMI